MDVIQDMEDVMLSKKDKIKKKEKNTSLRKEALGKIYIDCPHWNSKKKSVFQNKYQTVLNIAFRRYSES